MNIKCCTLCRTVGNIDRTIISLDADKDNVKEDEGRYDRVID